jgi:putative endonuclease
MKYGGFVYIITNQYNTVLYTGVTSALLARIEQHPTKFFPNSFSAKYNCNKIVWYEFFPRIEIAIEREKQIEAGNRKSKEKLINAMNPSWLIFGMISRIYKFSSGVDILRKKLKKIFLISHICHTQFATHSLPSLQDDDNIFR